MSVGKKIKILTSFRLMIGVISAKYMKILIGIFSFRRSVAVVSLLAQLFLIASFP